MSAITPLLGEFAMAKSERIAKREQDYEPDVARCETCIFYRSLSRRRKICRLGRFLVNRFGVCDRWTNREGEKLVK